MNTIDKTRNRLLPVMVFTGGVLVYLLAVLPFLISRKGLFFYYGDYNVQQVPFLIFAHRAVRRGILFWNPLVDLGGNMTGIFAFYIWGSPFFWLTIPFPESWLPYMMPYLMALKFGTAAVTSFAWIRTQTRSAKAAVLGAYLYAFSGFQACNIVFQHFHDVTAFFPLYLLAFDRFIAASRQASERSCSAAAGRTEADLSLQAAQPHVKSFLAGLKRAGAGGLLGFTLMTAFMSIVNYYFFFGQVLFFILYYTVRWGIRRAQSGGVKALTGEFLRILAAGAAGLLLSSFFLVQSIGGILGNTRVTKVLSGYDLIAYPDATTPLAILKSFFMVPDLIARGTLFSSDSIRNGSLAFFLPCFAMAGVFAYWISRRKSWKKTLLSIFAVMVFVPFLNAAFSAFNANFYTRWFYMPVLLCACMTAEALEQEDSTCFTRGALLSLVCTGVFILFCFLPVEDRGVWSFTGICENRKLLTGEIKGTLFSAAALLVILLLRRRFGVLFPDKKNCMAAAQPLPAAAAQPLPAAAALPLPAAADPGLTGEGPESPETAVKETEARGFYSRLRGMGILTPGTACLLLTMICCFTSTSVVIRNGSSLISYTGFEKWKRQMLTERPLLAPSGETSPESPDGHDGDALAETTRVFGTDRAGGPVPGVDAPFSRVETDNTSTNYEMVWGYPTMHCFESTVHPSIFTWYRGIGMIRTVESTLPLERIGARAVMSVRYYIENTLVKPDKSYTDQGGIKGYTLLNEENGYKVYETENYIPMGFSFDSYMTEENYDILENGPVSDRVLVKDIILSKEMAAKYGDLLTEDRDIQPGEMDYREFADHCRDRAASACTEFGFDRNGFHATAKMDRDNLLLFSIPYDKGFSVQIDGKPAEAECADFGLTAIFVPEGRHEIIVTYLPQGFVPAAAVSALTAVLILALAVFCRRG